MTPLLLLPGMMCDARLYAPQIAAFEAARAVIVPRLSADSMAAMAEAVLAEAPARFALAGLSMGGILAMEIAARAPERVERLALLDTNPRDERPDRRALRAPQIARVREGGLRAVMRDELMPYYTVEGPRQGAILDLCEEMALELGPEVFAAQSIALRDRPDYTEALSGFAMPSLVLCGRHDALCPLARHELMAERIPGARLSIIEDAGHLPTLEQPAATTAALADWLETP